MVDLLAHGDDQVGGRPRDPGVEARGHIGLLRGQARDFSPDRVVGDDDHAEGLAIACRRRPERGIRDAIERPRVDLLAGVVADHAPPGQDI